MSRRFLAAAAKYHNHNHTQHQQYQQQYQHQQQHQQQQQFQQHPPQPSHSNSNSNNNNESLWEDDPHVSAMAIVDTKPVSPSSAPLQSQLQSHSQSRSYAPPRSQLHPQSHPHHLEEEELRPEEGALQFLPALEEDWRSEKKTENEWTAWPDQQPSAQLQPQQPSGRHVTPTKARSEAAAPSASRGSMAARARQYKQLRQQQQQHQQHQQHSTKPTAATSVVSRAPSSAVLASNLLQSAAQKLRNASPPSTRPKSPLLSRPKSPLLSRPKSPLLSRPKSPLLSRPKSPSNFFASARKSVVHRPKSPLAYQHEELDEQDETNDSASLEPKKQQQQQQQKPSQQPSQESAGGRVSRLASMFGGGRSSPPPQRPKTPTNNSNGNSNGNTNSNATSSTHSASLYRRLPATKESTTVVAPTVPALTTTATTPTKAYTPSSPTPSPSANTKANPKFNTNPPHYSPKSSTSGSSYVGWPGTQDKRGKTVMMPQSSNEFEDDDDEAQNYARRFNSSNGNNINSSSSSSNQNPIRHPHAHTSRPRSTTPTSSQQGLPRVTPSPPPAPRHNYHTHHLPDRDDEDNQDYVAQAIQQSSPSRRQRPLQQHPLSQPLQQQQQQHHSQPEHVNPARRRRMAHSATARHARHDSEASSQESSNSDYNNNNNNNNNSNNFRAAPLPNQSFALGAKGRNWGMTMKKQHSNASSSSNAGDPPSSPSTAFSKTSSAYFNERDLNPLAYPDLQQQQQQGDGEYAAALPMSVRASFNPYGRGRSMSAAAAASVLRSQQQQQQMEQKGQREQQQQQQQYHYSHQPPTEESLAANNHLAPPHRSFSSGKGFGGLLDKTQEFPALMDLNDSDNSSRATSNASRQESDVFDGIGAPSTETTNDAPTNLNLAMPHKFVRSNSRIKKAHYPESIAEEREDFELPESGPSPARAKVIASRTKKGEPFSPQLNQADEPHKMVLLGGGLTAIQSSTFGYATRQTPSDYDETLTNSEVESNGYTRTPSLAEMMNAGKTRNDTSVLGSVKPNSFSGDDSNVSDEDDLEVDDVDDDDDLSDDPYSGGTSVFYPTRSNLLAKYYVDPNVMKKLLRVYREMSDQVTRNMSLNEFELLEDENKAFALFEMRSRIMEKDMDRGLERRGGTVTVDDIVLTPYHRTAMRIRDAVIVAKAWRDGASPRDVTNTALLTRRAEKTYFIRRPMHRNHHSSASSVVSGGLMNFGNQSRYYWEAVKWIDDTDFVLYRCPSLGPRSLRGFEMFTIGDCQSILLKLTNERCVELRAELNAATKHQLVAEEQMKEEEGEFDGDGFMTESEMEYLAAMEQVKSVSKKLVVAEQAFTLVRDRIEKLIAKYESLLVQIDNDGSVAGASSIVTYDESSIFSETQEEREAQLWARRAKRAELKAEVAAREALMARQEADWIRQESQIELERVQQKLAELQSEASTAISHQQHHAVFHNLPRSTPEDAPMTEHNHSPPHSHGDKQKIEGVKQRFRDRMSAKKNPFFSSPVPTQYSHSQSAPIPVKNQHQPRRQPLVPDHLVRAAGEEMMSHLDFYDRVFKSSQVN